MDSQRVRPLLILPAAIKKQTKNDTLSQPSRNDAISTLSKVIHRHILRHDVKINSTENELSYNIDNFIPRRYSVQIPTMVKCCGITAFQQKLRPNIVPNPDVRKIRRLCKRIVERARLQAECSIIALIYIERLMELKGVNLNARNWIPILVAALLTSSKVWDDHSTFNADLTAILPIFSVPSINELERQFLGDLNYSLHIKSSDYARYYFAMRALRDENVKNIPKYYLNLGIGAPHDVGRKTLKTESTARGLPFSV